MKITCTSQEYFDLHEVMTAGACWIGSGEGYQSKTVDLEKFRMATNMMGVKSTIEWEIEP